MNPPPISDEIIPDVSQIFGSLGDVSRLKILRALMAAQEPLCQGIIADRAGLSQANTSKHLTLLVRVGLVTREPRGNLVYFRPATSIVGSVCELVCGHVTTRIESAFRSLA